MIYARDLMLRKIIVFLTSVFLALISILASAATIGAWTVSNPMAVGASMLYDGSKGTVTSSVLITPNASQVAKVLRGGLAGYALTFAVEQLLGAVDWVLDPANNQIVYHSEVTPKDPQKTDKYLWSYNGSGVFSNFTINYKLSAVDICSAVLKSSSGLSPWYYDKVSVKYVSASQISCFVSSSTTTFNGSASVFRLANPDYDPNAKPEEKTLPLETVAQKVIENAESDNLDAQFAVLAAANNILSEAEQDQAKAKPIEDELENNAKCPSGIVNNGSCWVCSRESHAPIRVRVVYAKDVVGGLGKCEKFMNSSELLTRYRAYSELGAARDAENVCWVPQDKNHLDEALDAKRIVADCNTYLGLLGQ
ncbi:MAG: hypothetical protein EOO99_12115 [Pedobacter sp.]|nr:MAG: hypothetical protein EOO99_12115 [Pedobacter sp.]